MKGHQDTDKHGNLLHGPFKKEVQLNILVDELATRGMEIGKILKLRRPNFSTTVLSIYDKDGKHINDVRSYMTEKINGGRLMEYMKKRRGWTQQVMETIDWEGINGMLRTANPMRRTRLIQMLHNWQNIGKQKGIFRDARIKQDKESTNEPTEEEKSCHLCPEGCGEEEKELHYLHCPDALSIKSRRTLIRKVLRRLKAIKTYDGITSTIGLILNSINKRETVVIDKSEYRKDGHLSLTGAMLGQEKIGWMALCQGYFHKDWTKIQFIHYKRAGIDSKVLNIDRWKKMFCTILGEYCLDCWHNRNEVLYGKELED